MDGKAERTDNILEDYLRHFMWEYQYDWSVLLGVAQFSYNMMTILTTRYNPFKLVTGMQLLNPHIVAIGSFGKNPITTVFMKSWKTIFDIDCIHMMGGNDMMKKWE